MNSRSSPQALPSRARPAPARDAHRHQERGTAQLAQGGPAGISLRAIARELGMTASAVNYYFPGRGALLDALIVHGWDSLAMTLRARYELARPHRPTSGG